MGNIIGTSTERMKTDITDYGTSVQKVDEALKNAYAAIEELNRTWSGPAHDALVAQFEADQLTMNDLLKDLRDYGSDLDNARNEYEKCEANVDSLINSMKV